jgi:gliding motility-associated lipoprotein GldH
VETIPAVEIILTEIKTQIQIQNSVGSLKGFFIVIVVATLSSCDTNKVYLKYIDFEEGSWMVNDKPRFEFTVEDPQSTYNVYCNIRNSTQYPNARIFVNFAMNDTLGNVLYNKLLSEILFEPKTGKPEGNTGLGDLFDHRIEVLKNHKFAGRGPYIIQLEQFMRTDTLTGVISVGVEIEKGQP